MLDAELIKVVEDSLREVLLWVGFGTLVGLAAKAIMPGRDPGGTLVTLLLGISGSVIGCGTVLLAFDGHRLDPISSTGFAAATAGAFFLLFIYRLLSGTLIQESEDGDILSASPQPQPQPRRRKRKRHAA